MAVRQLVLPALAMGRTGEAGRVDSRLRGTPLLTRAACPTCLALTWRGWSKGIQVHGARPAQPPGAVACAPGLALAPRSTAPWHPSCHSSPAPWILPFVLLTNAVHAPTRLPLISTSQSGIGANKNRPPLVTLRPHKGGSSIPHPVLFRALSAEYFFWPAQER